MIVKHREVINMGKSVQKAYRTNTEDYDEVKEILEAIGMTVPQAINIFFKRIKMEKQLPFTPGIVKSKAQLEAEAQIAELVKDIPVVTLNFETGENVEEFFND